MFGGRWALLIALVSGRIDLGAPIADGILVICYGLRGFGFIFQFDTGFLHKGRFGFFHMAWP